jgi:5'-nucleotidase
MDILLTNDDGVSAPALWALYDELQSLGRVTVVAPRSQQSGVGHGITYLTAITSQRVRLDGRRQAYAVDGTPADCVKFALLELLSEPPGLVVSGINMGLNLGYNIFYSGTVAAAIEGAMNGVPSVAFSCSHGNEHDLCRVARQALRVLRVVMERPARGSRGALAYNVNLPMLCDGAPRILFTPHRATAFRERYVPDQKNGAPGYRLDVASGDAGGRADGCDVEAVAAGMISITPLRPCLTDVDALRLLDASRTPEIGQQQPHPHGGERP